MAGLELELPKDLPTGSLSYSAIMSYLRCPISYRNRYLLNQWEPRSGKMMRGTAFDKAAIGTNFRQKITTQEDLPVQDVMDAYATAWEAELQRTDEPEVAFEDSPDLLKDEGYRAIQVYQAYVAPKVQPVAVQRKLQMHFPDTNWTFTGILDVETDGEVVADLKVKGKNFSANELAGDQQSSAYLALRRANNEPARRFEFHVTRPLVTKTDTTISQIERSNAELDTFELRVAMIAKEIYWRAENDHWQAALPGSWWCSNSYCGFYATCKFGGGS